MDAEDHEDREVGLSVGAKAVTTAMVTAKAMIRRLDIMVNRLGYYCLLCS